MNERIRQLRRALDITQQEFADKLGVVRNNIAGYEIGNRNPSDAVVSLICREFNVNKEWLVNGEGEMFIEMSRDEDYTDIIQVLTSLDKDDWQLLLHTAFVLANKKEVINK